MKNKIKMEFKMINILKTKIKALTIVSNLMVLLIKKFIWVCSQKSQFLKMEKVKVGVKVIKRK